MESHDLTGRVALVTGAASPSGTGFAMASALLGAGARVAVLDLKAEWMDESVGRLREIGGADAVLGVVADVTDPEAVESAVRQTIKDLGGLHVLINNAGTNPRAAGFDVGSRRFWDVSVPAFDRVVAVNFAGPFYTSRAVIDHMREQDWGRIIGVTTSVDTMFGKRRVPYGPSKAGHEALVATMAEELEGTGVTANVLVPGGPTNTNFMAGKSEEERARLIQPEVMQAPAVWLSSDASSGCNGRRIIACRWDPELPTDARLSAASAPAAWPQLGRQAVLPDG